MLFTVSGCSRSKCPASDEVAEEAAGNATDSTGQTGTDTEQETAPAGDSDADADTDTDTDTDTDGQAGINSDGTIPGTDSPATDACWPEGISLKTDQDVLALRPYRCIEGSISIIDSSLTEVSAEPGDDRKLTQHRAKRGAHQSERALLPGVCGL